MLGKINARTVVALIAALVWGLAVPAGVRAEDVKLNPDHPQSYTVRKGDTLWDLASRFLTQPWRWPDIWHANPQVRNPDLIYPGDVLTLVYINGQPALELSSGDRHIGGRLYKRSPTVRESAHADSIAPIPLDAIGPFLRQPLVVGEHELEHQPYIVSSEDQHLVNGSGINVYIRGLPADGKTTHYSVFRRGDPYRSPGAAPADVLGYEALDVGELVVTRFGDPAVGRLTRVTREVLNGDRLIALRDEQASEFVPHAPGREVHGHIVNVIDGVNMVGSRQVVVLDVGKNQGVEPGNVLAIQVSSLIVRDSTATDLKEQAEDARRIKFARSETRAADSVMEHFVNDVRATKRRVDKALGIHFDSEPEEVNLPPERAGEAMVFRVFDHVSYALVMNQSRTVRVEDGVTNP